MAKTRLVLSAAFVVVLVLLLVAPGVASAAPLDSPGASTSYSPQASNSNWSVCWYRVRWGDTLTRIAFRYGTSIWTLAAMNHIHNVDRIYAGMWLRVPCVMTKYGYYPRY